MNRRNHMYISTGRSSRRPSTTAASLPPFTTPAPQIWVDTERAEGATPEPEARCVVIRAGRLCSSGIDSGDVRETRTTY